MKHGYTNARALAQPSALILAFLVGLGMLGGEIVPANAQSVGVVTQPSNSAAEEGIRDAREHAQSRLNDSGRGAPSRHFEGNVASGR